METVKFLLVLAAGLLWVDFWLAPRIDRLWPGAWARFVRTFDRVLLTGVGVVVMWGIVADIRRDFRAEEREAGKRKSLAAVTDAGDARSSEQRAADCRAEAERDMRRALEALADTPEEDAETRRLWRTRYERAKAVRDGWE